MYDGLVTKYIVLAYSQNVNISHRELLFTLHQRNHLYHIIDA